MPTDIHPLFNIHYVILKMVSLVVISLGLNILVNLIYWQIYD